MSFYVLFCFVFSLRLHYRSGPSIASSVNRLERMDSGGPMGQPLRSGLQGAKMPEPFLK